ncbi:hypothetical protein ACFL6B_02610 [Thermodesulfobacteriota bacterium]
MSTEPIQSQATTLFLTVEKDRVPVFFPLLGTGFTLKIKVGCSVRELLCDQLGLSADYLENRLQTIFLDGKTVDDVKVAVVQEGATLALSAAMPGLAGATLRRGGAYAAMRHQITHQKKLEKEMVKEGTIQVKLFNLVTRDIGPMFLEQGIWISGDRLHNFFQKAPAHFWTGCSAAEIDGIYREVDKLSHVDWEHQEVFLKLTIK